VSIDFFIADPIIAIKSFANNVNHIELLLSTQLYIIVKCMKSETAYFKASLGLNSNNSVAISFVNKTFGA